MHRWFLTSVLCVAFSAAGSGALAQSAASVLVVANESVPGSIDIALRYIAARKVPGDHLVRLKTSAALEVSRRDFEVDIQTPIAAWLASHAAQDRILYLVLTRGVPLRIPGTLGRNGTASSVDSELTLLYRRTTGVLVPPNGPIANPYYAAGGIDGVKPFSHAAQDIYLVTRLDGFTVADAMGLIERGISPSKNGRVLLDQPPASRDVRSTWFEAAVARLGALGFADRVVHETTSRALLNQPDVLGYYSWGSNDPSLEVRQPGLKFVNGALASMFLSSDARTFVEPPAAWTPGRTRLQSRYAGTSQSLIGDLVRAGATGVSGQVAEPYLDGATRPDLLFPAYLMGLNLAESFYASMPYLSWQSIVVGDPLCAPFRPATLAADNADPALDPDTEMPALFSARRLAAVQRPGANSDVLKLMVRAEARSARDDIAGATDTLTKAVGLDATSIDAWRALGLELERARKYSEAAAAYRRVLDLNRNDVVALNNLAYIVAVRENRPQDALPIATRAATLDRGNPLVQDTLAWIHHLVGDNQEAARLLAPASRAMPWNADVQFHTAVVFHAVGRVDEAAKALDAAIAIDASLKERPDVIDLQRKVRRTPPGKES